MASVARAGRLLAFVGLAGVTACSLLVETGDLAGGATPGFANATPEASADAGAIDALDATQDADVAPETARAVYRAAVLADGPLVYLHLDETSGLQAADEVGPPSTYVASCALGAPGIFEGAPGVRCDGGAGGIRVAGAIAFDGTKPLTIEVWYAPEGYDTEYRFLGGTEERNDAGLQQYGVWAQSEFGLMFERYKDGVPVNVGYPLPPLGAYRYLVATYDGAALRLYIDGAIIDSVPDTRSRDLSAAEFWFASDARSAPTILGALDEVAIYGKALSAERVNAHFHAAGR